MGVVVQAVLRAVRCTPAAMVSWWDSAGVPIDQSGLTSATRLQARLRVIDRWLDFTGRSRAAARLPRLSCAKVRTQAGRARRSEHARAGGTSSAVHALTVDDARGAPAPCARRYVRADWPAEESDLPEHEAGGFAPGAVGGRRWRLVAVRPERRAARRARGAHDPARSIRWAPRYRRGSSCDQSTRCYDSCGRGPDCGSRSAASRPIPGPSAEPPAGRSCPAAWERAIEVHAGPPPVSERAFIHRDFHPGNVCGAGTSRSGIVDWSVHELRLTRG